MANKTERRGQPPKLTPQLIENARTYLQTWRLRGEEVIPTVPGLALCVGVSSRSLYNYADAPPEDSTALHDQFREVWNRLKDEQHQILMSNGLTNKFNSNITKLLLFNHGHSEKVTQDVNNPDGKLQAAKPVDLSGLSNEQLTVLAQLAERNTTSD
jgi:hypothetical protein